MQLEYLGATIVRLDEEEPATARAMIKCFSVSIAADDGQKQDGFGYLSLAPELLSALFERFFWRPWRHFPRLTDRTRIHTAHPG